MFHWFGHKFLHSKVILISVRDKHYREVWNHQIDKRLISQALSVQIKQ